MGNVMGNTRRYAWVAFWIISAHFFISYFHRVCPAVVAPDLMKSFGISAASLGVLASSYFLSYGVMQIPVGILADSWGVKRTVTLFGGLTALGGVAFGLAPSFGWATAARILVGIGVSAFFVCAMKLFADWFTGNRYARISGLFLGFGGLGWFAATTPLAYLAQGLGWRGSFLVIGGAGLLLTVCTWLWLVERPSDARICSARSASSNSPGDAAPWGSFLLVVRTWRFWVLAVWIFCTNGFSFGFQGLWAGPYLMDVYGFSAPAAGTVLSMAAFAVIFGAPFLGFLSDRVFHSRKKVLVGGAVILLVSLTTLLAFHGRLSYAALCTVFFFLGLTSNAIGTIGITAAKELFPNDIAGTAIGTLNVFPFIGGIVFQLYAGMILDVSGSAPYPPAASLPVLYFFLAALTISRLCTLFVRETFGR